MLWVSLWLAVPAAPGNSQHTSVDESGASAPAGNSGSDLGSGYVLGPEDQISVWALGAEELTDKPFQVDSNGYVDFPLIGPVRAAGLTTEQLKNQMVDKLSAYVRQPQVSITVTEFGSQPVSVIGAVNTPGVIQLRSRKTLMEVLSLAGGLSPDASHKVTVTRNIKWGRIPLPTVDDDSTGEYSVAEISLQSIMEAKAPQNNITIRPHDVISVPRARLVYVVGHVRTPGGFVLHEREEMSVLQAISMAQGFDEQAAPANARILRPAEGASDRVEVAVNLKRIMAGRTPDVPMYADDILFVPASGRKKVTQGVIDTAIRTVSGILIFRR